METLPVEILEHILGYSSLKIDDVVNLSSTCVYLRNVVNGSHYIWKTIFIKQWPHLEKVGGSDVDWVSEVRYIYSVRKKVREILNTMPSKFYTSIDLSPNDFSEWQPLVEENERTYHYIYDYLRDSINDSSPINSIEVVPLMTPGNKTLRYYGLKVMQYLRQCKVRGEFRNYMSLPEKRQILEMVAIMVARWCQPEVGIQVEYEHVRDVLDGFMQEAKDELRKINAKHPLFTVPFSTLAVWRDENLERNQFSGAHNMEIINAIRVMFFEKNHFTGNVTDYYLPVNSFINCVFDNKCGLPITLSVIYESVARRMGVKCDPMNYPAHFLLRFQPDPSSNSVLFIDAFNDGQVFPRGICHYSSSSPDLIPRASARQVMSRMAANLVEAMKSDIQASLLFTQIRPVLELAIMTAPEDLDAIDELTRAYMTSNMDIQHIKNVVENTTYARPSGVRNFLSMVNEYEFKRQDTLTQQSRQGVQVKLRTEPIKYAIGMVMQHKLYHYKAVITDWNPICMADMNWQRSMSVFQLQHKANQPFYNVIVEDGSHRYVAEENIIITNQTGQLHLIDEIGRHFSHFFVNHYVPNADKEREYPDDTLVRQNYYQSKLWNP